MEQSLLEQCPGIYFITDNDGVITHANSEAKRFFGEGCAPGQALAEIVHPTARAGFTTLWQGLPKDGTTLHDMTQLRVADQQYKVFCFSARRPQEGSAVHVVMHPAPAETRLVAHRPETDPERIMRALLDRLEVVVTTLDEKGKCTFNEGRSLITSGLGINYNLGKNIFEAYADAPMVTDHARRALNGEDCYFVVDAHNVNWENWYVSVKDENGKVQGAICVSLDNSKAKQALTEIQSKLELIQRQQEVIRTLETPIIEVWDRVITLPMMGVIDSLRAARVMDDLLGAVARLGARYAILDLTAVDIVDTATAAHLLGLVSAVRLLGADSIITGIRPTVAQTIVSLGLDLTHVTTCSNLREALKLCIRNMNAATMAESTFFKSMA